MQLDNQTIFVSGANRGIGKAIVESLLKHKVKKIYAAARKPSDLPDFGDARVVPVTLDITILSQVQQAAAQAGDIDILINNAGTLSLSSILNATDSELQHDMLVNYFGTLHVIRAFTAGLEKKGHGAIANVISIVGLASMAGIGGYSASKAALFSATQAMRAELKAKHISVHGIFPGPIDTDMAREFDMQKTSPAVTADNILKGLINDQEDIFPDPMSSELGTVWAKDPKGLERQFASM